MRRMRAHWAHYSNNFGDILTPMLLKHFGVEAVWVGRGSPGKLLAVGTIFERARPNDVIWGSGAIPKKDGGRYAIPEGATILAVRGPLTRALIDGDVPEVYGDPGLLLPQVYNPEVEVTHDVGVLMHEVDKDQVPEGVHEDPSVLVIDVNSGVESVVHAIKRCSSVISSSLHGIVAAEAYGIPAVWIQPSRRVFGGGYKYRDYYLSTNREVASPAPWPLRLSTVDQYVPPAPVINLELLVDALHGHFGSM